MILYDMLVMSDKNLGTKGDCMRACVATLTQTPPETMPHFVGDPDEPNWVFGLNKWLAQRGLFYVQAPHQRMFWHSRAGDVYHLLVGKTIRGTQHAAVAKNGEILHDPHPSRAGFVDAGEHNTNLQAGFLVQRSPT